MSLTDYRFFVSDYKKLYFHLHCAVEPSKVLSDNDPSTGEFKNTYIHLIFHFEEALDIYITCDLLIFYLSMMESILSIHQYIRQSLSSFYRNSSALKSD